MSKTRVGGPSGGYYHRVRHPSSSTKTEMVFGLYLPMKHQNNNNNNNNNNSSSTPVLYWLSGLTCDDTNFSNKAGSRAFNAAERMGIAIVCPDTSPRQYDGNNNVSADPVPDVDSYDLGIGAGFYVNATEAPYKTHYRMYDYVTKELPDLLEREFHLGSGKRSICGHSMGGHGALTIALRDPTSWVSVSAFSPICNPTAVPWGQKAFRAYLGSVEAGNGHDATLLLTQRTKYDDILIEQGDADQFLEEQLKPQALEEAAKKCGQKVTVNMREGFDHSYHFIAAFIEDHVEFHGKRLNA